jgi:hypothetical protein
MRGKQEKTQELTPEAKEQYQLAKQLGAIGTPMYRGPEIAAVNQAELASRGNVNEMASALGLQGAGSLSIGAPTATQGGVTGYTTYQGGQAALDMLKRFEPGRYKALMDMMIDPVTGKMPDFVSGSTPAAQAAPASSGGGGGDDGPNMREFMDQARENARKPSSVPYTGDYPNMSSMPAIAGYTTPATPAESTFASDLSRSLTDSSYDPPGTVFSRTVDKLKTGLLG